MAGGLPGTKKAYPGLPGTHARKACWVITLAALLLDAVDLDGLGVNVGNDLLLLLLAGHEGGGRKGENSDGLHNNSVCLCYCVQSARRPGWDVGGAYYNELF